MSRPRPDPETDRTPGDATAEALSRAHDHALRAVAEALRAGRALLEAAARALSGTPAEGHPLFGAADAALVAAIARVDRGDPLGRELGPALAEALDAEIARWEARAREEDEARAVLRAFLGLRELLWELGVRPAADAAGPAAAPRRARGASPASAAPTRPEADRPARKGVERVPVVGS